MANDKRGEHMQEEYRECPWCHTSRVHYEASRVGGELRWRLVHSTSECGGFVATPWAETKEECRAMWNAR